MIKSANTAVTNLFLEPFQATTFLHTILQEMPFIFQIQFKHTRSHGSEPCLNSRRVKRTIIQSWELDRSESSGRSVQVVFLLHLLQVRLLLLSVQLLEGLVGLVVEDDQVSENISQC